MLFRSAQDDRLCLGETVNLNEAQIKELALLPVGEAVVCREGMEKAFRVQVDLAARGKEQISDEDCREKMATFHERAPPRLCALHHVRGHGGGLAPVQNHA